MHWENINDKDIIEILSENDGAEEAIGVGDEEERIQEEKDLKEKEKKVYQRC